MNKKERSYLEDKILTFTKNTDWVIEYEFEDEKNEKILDPKKFTAGEYRLFTRNLLTYFSVGQRAKTQQPYEGGPIQAFKDLNTILAAHLNLLKKNDFSLEIHFIASFENLSNLWKEMLESGDDFPKYIKKIRKKYRRQKLKDRLQGV